MTKRFITAKYNIGNSTLKSWQKKVEKGEAFHATSVKPLKIDAMGRTKLLNEMHEHESEGYNMTRATFEGKLDEVVQDTQKRRNIPMTAWTKAKKTCRWQLCADLNLKVAMAEETTPARYKAVADIRNTASFIVMNLLMVSLSSKYLIMNMDATQFTVGSISPGGKHQVVFVESNGRTLKVPPSNGLLNMRSRLVFM